MEKFKPLSAGFRRELVRPDKSCVDITSDYANWLFQNEPDRRIIVSFSGGKDSTVTLDIMLKLARKYGRLPLDVVHREEEVLYPATYEYIERVKLMPDIRFHHLCAFQPSINIFNRTHPYWWVFDEEEKDKWVRPLPPDTVTIKDKDIRYLITNQRFGNKLVTCIGLRARESYRRSLTLHRRTVPFKLTSDFNWSFYPLFGWDDSDIWKYIKDNNLDYSRDYDIMNRFGVSPFHMRIAPPTQMRMGIKYLRVWFAASPIWFAKLEKRCPGVQLAVDYDTAAILPRKAPDENWKECFFRECVEEAPDWIRTRALNVWERYRKMLKDKAGLSDIPDTFKGSKGMSTIIDYRYLARNIYMGDPFSTKFESIGLKPVEPELFRKGSGTWFEGIRSRHQF